MSLSDIFALQDEITLKIVDALKVKLLPEESKAIKAVPTGNVEAYTYCLRGREFLNIHYARYYPLARNMFTKAVELDPSFAQAYAGIADCDSYSFLTRKEQTTITSMLDSSAKAIELGPDLAAAHASRGLACWGAERLSEAEAEYMRALELDPNLYEANYFYGRYCRAMGRLDQAAELFERAAEVRPVDYKSVGRRFESYAAHHHFNDLGAAAPGFPIFGSRLEAADRPKGSRFPLSAGRSVLASQAARRYSSTRGNIM